MWSCTSILRTWQSQNNIFGITQLYIYLEIDASPVWVWFGKLGASILTPWLDQIWCPGQHIQSCGPLPQVFWGWLLERKHAITQVCAHRRTLADSLKKASHKLAVLRTIGKKTPPTPKLKVFRKAAAGLCQIGLCTGACLKIYMQVNGESRFTPNWGLSQTKEQTLTWAFRKQEANLNFLKGFWVSACSLCKRACS